MNISNISKVELHRHLEGSQRKSTVIELTKKFGFNNMQFEVLEPMHDLQVVLDVFWAVQRLFQTPEIIERITYEVCEDAFFDGIKLLELRYSPSFLTYGHDISYQDAHDAILKGIKKAKDKYQIEVGLICIISRNVKLMPESNETIDFMIKNKNSFMALDFADREILNEIKLMKPFVERIRANDFKFTVHTGEDTDPEHILETIKHLSPDRIGHGIKVEFSDETMKIVKDKNICFEMCPTSNYMTKCVAQIRDHPIKRLLDKNIAVTINSDDPGIFGITLNNEYDICKNVLGFSNEDFKKTNLIALEHSFFDDDIKKYYKKFFV